MSDWYAVYETDNGRLVSVGTVLPDPGVGPGLTALLLGTNPPLDNTMWDPATRTFIARPAPVLNDLVEQLIAQPEIAVLSTARKNDVRAAGRRVLDSWNVRFQ